MTIDLDDIYEGISASVLSADLLRLEHDLKLIDSFDIVKSIHFDVMDGHFVPNISFGFDICKQIAYLTKKRLDVHLMVENPEQWISQYANIPSKHKKMITIHAEATHHLHRAISMIKENGCYAGVAINPGTDVSVLRPVLDNVDMILLMSVNPGFGGQKFIPQTIQKMQDLTLMMNAEQAANIVMQIDGGVNHKNIGALRHNFDSHVVGSGIFANNGRQTPQDKVLQNLQALTKAWNDEGIQAI